MTPQQRMRHRRRMARRRIDKIRRGECIRCVDAVAFDERTGLPLRMCPFHLRLDKERKVK